MFMLLTADGMVHVISSALTSATSHDPVPMVTLAPSLNPYPETVSTPPPKITEAPNFY